MEKKTAPPLGEEKELTVDNAIMLRKPIAAGRALTTAIEGNSEAALQMIENAYIESGYSYSDIIDSLQEALPSVTDEEVRNRLHVKLAEVQSNCSLPLFRPTEKSE